MKEKMSKEEKAALKQAKLTWREEMRAYFPGWTKKHANKRDVNGRLMMNVPMSK